MKTSPVCRAIIPAAGIGQRMASSTPKQYLKIKDKTVLEYSSQALLENEQVENVVFALHAEDAYFESIEFNNKHKIRNVVGGQTRAHSVLNALESIKKETKAEDFVLVHDAARPCLSMSDLVMLIDVCVEHDVGGILAAPATDTIKQVQENKITDTLDRSKIWRAFTPQMFKFNILYEAIKQAFVDKIEITDEASAVEYAGYQPCVVEGSVQNIKVTSPEDLVIAEMYLGSSDLL